MGMKVAVLMGGASFEREFSLASGKNVCAALEEAGHKVVPLDTTADLVPTLRTERPDVCYSALHGKHGEDGTIQSLLEFLDIPFVGSPSHVCHRTWNKDSMHYELATYRAITGDAPIASWPQGIYLARDAFKDMGAATALDLVQERVIGGYPVAVKPAHGGSAMGVHRVDSVDELGEAILDALSFDEAVVIEQWVEGVEMAVSVLGTGWDAYALPPVEIVPKQGFFGTEARMEPGAVQYIAPVRPASLSDDEGDAQAIRAEIERAALEVYRAYNARDLARVDLIWDGAQARVFEVNVSPGMAERSLFPAACEAAGLSLSSVLNELVTQYAKLPLECRRAPAFSFASKRQLLQTYHVPFPLTAGGAFAFSTPSCCSTLLCYTSAERARACGAGGGARREIDRLWAYLTAFPISLKRTSMTRWIGARILPR